METSSSSNSHAVHAVKLLRSREWLIGEKGILEGQDLWGADLSEAYLWRANLKNANLRYVRFRGTYLQGADLSGADLEYCDLANADLKGAIFSRSTILPDAERVDDHGSDTILEKRNDALYTKESFWTPETNMEIYTNPEHPQFYEPGWVKRKTDPKYEGH